MMMSLSLDGLLDEQDEQELFNHVGTCEACADLWDRMSLVQVMFSRPVEAVPPVNLTARVMARVETHEAGRRWYPLLIGVLVASSVVAALTIALPILFFALGLHSVVASWPVAGLVLSYGLQIFAVAQAVAAIAVDALTGWIGYVFSDPVAMTVVLTALVLASTWIGLLEGFKAVRLSRAAQQA
jgi:anti-sigma factor RsiW